MIAFAYLIWGLIVTCVLFAVGVGVLALVDCMDRGDRQIEEAMEQMEAARAVTGHTEPTLERTRP